MVSREPQIPGPSYLFDQHLPSVQPSCSPFCLAAFLALFGAAFLALGVPALTASTSVVRFDLGYDKACTDQLQAASTTPGGVPGCVSVHEFTVTERVPAPVYMHYVIRDMQINHRLSSRSRSDVQLSGHRTTLGLPDYVRFCNPYRWRGEVSGASNPGQYTFNQQYNPCGTWAHAMFNDSFLLTVPADGNRLICDTAAPPTATCYDEPLAWPQDRFARYRSFPPSATEYSTYPAEYADETGHVIPNPVSTPFINWMRLSQTSTPVKPLRKIDESLEVGVVYRLVVTQRFPVWQWKGDKNVWFSTISWWGGRNEFPGCVMVISGAACLCAAVAMVATQLIAPREKGNVRAVLPLFSS